MDGTLTTVVWSIVGSVLAMIVCGVMLYRGDREAIRLYNLKYSERHSDEERAVILGKMKQQLQWFYGVCTLLFTGILIKYLIVLFRG